MTPAMIDSGVQLSRPGVVCTAVMATRMMRSTFMCRGAAWASCALTSDWLSRVRSVLTCFCSTVSAVVGFAGAVAVIIGGLRGLVGLGVHLDERGFLDVVGLARDLLPA